VEREWFKTISGKNFLKVSNTDYMASNLGEWGRGCKNPIVTDLHISGLAMKYKYQVTGEK